jgi:hypothetical protein
MCNTATVDLNVLYDTFKGSEFALVNMKPRLRMVILANALKVTRPAAPVINRKFQPGILPNTETAEAIFYPSGTF